MLFECIALVNKFYSMKFYSISGKMKCSYCRFATKKNIQYNLHRPQVGLKG